MDLRLKGRTAVVTGASKGIGKAIARGLAQEGVNLVVLARGKEALDQAADQIRREQGVKVLAVQADVREIGQVKAAADAAKTEFGTVHIVVNNAGSGIRRQDRQITWPDSDWVDDLNLKPIGALRVTQSFMPISAARLDRPGHQHQRDRRRVGVHRRAHARAQQLGDEPYDVVSGPRPGGRKDHGQHRRARADRHRVAPRLGREHGQAAGKSKEQFVEDLPRVGHRAGAMRIDGGARGLRDVPRFRPRGLHQRRAHRIRRRCTRLIRVDDVIGRALSGSPTWVTENDEPQIDRSLAALTLAGFAVLAAEERPDESVFWKIWQEATARSQILQTVHILTDVYGPRLTGSPNLKAASDWALQQMASWD